MGIKGKGRLQSDGVNSEAKSQAGTLQYLKRLVGGRRKMAVWGGGALAWKFELNRLLLPRSHI